MQRRRTLFGHRRGGNRSASPRCHCPGDMVLSELSRTETHKPPSCPFCVGPTEPGPRPSKAASDRWTQATKGGFPMGGGLGGLSEQGGGDRRHRWAGTESSGGREGPHTVGFTPFPAGPQTQGRPPACVPSSVSPKSPCSPGAPLPCPRGPGGSPLLPAGTSCGGRATARLGGDPQGRHAVPFPHPPGDTVSPHPPGLPDTRVSPPPSPVPGGGGGEAGPAGDARVPASTQGSVTTSP